MDLMLHLSRCRCSLLPYSFAALHAQCVDAQPEIRVTQLKLVLQLSTWGFPSWRCDPRDQSETYISCMDVLYIQGM